MTPAALMNALLKAQVDLLWFGGIGTYIKASSQSQLDAGDRANDGLRINGNEVRAKVGGRKAPIWSTASTGAGRRRARAPASTPMRWTIPPVSTPPTMK